ncbi:TetR/AcrR family transcriptional regulator [Hydrogenimonas sp.]
MKELIKEKVLETKKNLVLEKVSEFFDESGFDGVKIQDIAAHTGLSVGALYKLFPSKEQLFYEYIAYQIRRFHEELMLACAGVEDPRTMLEIYIGLKFSTFVSKRKAIEDPVIGDPLFFVKMNTQKSDPAGPIYEFLADLFAQLAERMPLKERDHMKSAYLFNAYTMGFIEHWLNCGGDLDEDPAEVVERFLNGMRCRDE